MQPSREPQALPKDLLIHWTIFGALLFSLAVYVFIGLVFGAPLREDPATVAPVALRSVFYALGIATFPLIKLIRHITLRLNQTMPAATPAKNRYLVSIVISLAMSESIGLYGLILALLGDSVNSLWIFTFMAALAMLLYRPKFSEYQDIVTALPGEAKRQARVR